MTDDDLCRWSDLPPDQCALPCHRNESLPAGVEPEVRRGDDPTGVSTLLTEPSSAQHEPLDTRTRARRPKPPKTACRYDARASEWYTREHERDCDDRACQGCKPCPKDHCALFGCPSHVTPDVGIITCPTCISEFRGLVTEVQELVVLIAEELAHANTVEHEVTGPLSPIWTFRDITEVATLAGPYADPDQVDARETARGWCEWPRVIHPLDVLDRIERDLRVEYEHPQTDVAPAAWPMPHTAQVDVLTSACTYLTGMLDPTGPSAGRFPHDEPFERVFRDLKKLRVHLEGVLSDSRQPETGAPCPKCAIDLKDTNRKPPRLQKRHGHWCTDEKCKREHVKDDTADRWVCPYDSEHVWTARDYELWVAGAYLAHATRLTARQIREQYDIPTGTIRRWAAVGKREVDGESVEVAPKLRPAGKTQRGVLLYKVADVLALRARETHEKETSDA